MKDTDFFWDGVGQKKLLIQKCGDCGRLRQPPGPMCPTCQSLDWSGEPMSGQGQIYTWLLSKHPTEPDAEPRIVALIALQEGVRLVSNLCGIDVADIYPDMPVEMFFAQVGEHVLPQFRPVSTGAGQ